jgi:hypothetical protein
MKMQGHRYMAIQIKSAIGGRQARAEGLYSKILTEGKARTNCTILLKVEKEAQIRFE